MKNIIHQPLAKVYILLPFWLLAIFLFIRPLLDTFDESRIFGINQASPAAVLSIGIILFALYLAINQGGRVKNIPLLKWQLLLTFMLLPGLIFALDIFAGMRELLRIITSFALFYILFTLIKTNKDRLILLWVIVLASMTQVTIALAQYFSQSGNMLTADLIRVFGTYSHPNVFAASLLTSIPLIFFITLSAKNYYVRILGVIFGCAAFFCLIETYTRSAWISFAVIVMGVFLLFAKKYWNYLVILLLLALLLVLIFPNIITPITTRFANISTDPLDSLWSRLSLWQSAINALDWKTLLIGKGLGSFKILFDDEPHNEYLRMIFEGGIFSLMFYIILWSTVLITLINKFRIGNLTIFWKNLVYLTILITITFQIMGFADNNMGQPSLQMSLWALIAISIKELDMEVED